MEKSSKLKRLTLSLTPCRPQLLATLIPHFWAYLSLAGDFRTIKNRFIVLDVGVPHRGVWKECLYSCSNLSHAVCPGARRRYAGLNQQVDVLFIL